MADAVHIRAILEQNPHDYEARKRLIEIGSLNDLQWFYEQNPYDSEIKSAILQRSTGKHIRAILEQNPYDYEARKRLIEIGSLNDLQWFYEQNPYDSEIKSAILQRSTGKHIRAILEQNPYDYEARKRLIEIGSLNDLQWFYEQNPYDSEIKRALLNYEPKNNNRKNQSIKISNQTNILKKTSDNSHVKKFDVFISHASEDKESFVKELANELIKRKVKVWYDDFTLKVGDSLRRKIDQGLANSRYGVVVLSEHFFSKEWPQKELDGLTAREIGGKKVILPIWHEITKEEVLKYSPTLAGIYAANSGKESIPEIVDKLIVAMEE